MQFQIERGRFVQILNVSSSHWIIIANVGCVQGEMENPLQVFVMLMCASFGMGVPLSSFYPYGPTTSDSLLGPTDDGFSPPITTLSAFSYFGSPYTAVFHIQLTQPGGGVTKITDIILMAQHATINSLLMP
ncbi:hypothetical protein EMCRGX_G010395 [Ephydatia muelleri]